MVQIVSNDNNATPPIVLGPTGQYPLDAVRVQSAVVSAQSDNWEKVTALLGGTKAMRAKRERFLPKWQNEEPNSYDYRVRTTVLFNAFGHTVGSLAGKPFSRPMRWENMPDQIVPWFDNIDLTGRSLHVFCQEVFGMSLAYGLSHVLVDYPVADGIRTVADEKAQNVRPYLIHIAAPQVLGWQTITVNNAQVLSQLRILECVEVPLGLFQTRTIEQVRVLYRGTWEIYRLDENAHWALFDSGVSSNPEITLLTFYAGKRTGFMMADSPLIDIADLNIQHWQVCSDMFSVLHTASVPILTIVGVEANEEGTGPINVSAKQALMLPAGASASFTEHTGKAVEAGSSSLDDIEERMRILGAEMLVQKTGQATATQATLDTSQQRSELQSLTAIFEDLMDQVINVMCQWQNIDMGEGSVEVYKDFLLASDDAVQVALLFSMTTTGILSQQSYYEELQKRDILTNNLTWEQEQERIKAQPLPLPDPLAAVLPGQPKVENSSTTQALNG